MATVFCYISRQYLKFNFDPSIIVKSLIASGAMAIGIWAFAPEAAYEVVLSVIGGAIIYFIMLFLIRGIEKAEIRFLLQVLRLTQQKTKTS